MNHAPFVGFHGLPFYSPHTPRCQGTNHDSLRKVGPPQAIWSDDATLESHCPRHFLGSELGKAPMSPQKVVSLDQSLRFQQFYWANKSNNIPIIVTHAHLKFCSKGWLLQSTSKYVIGRCIRNRWV